MVVVARRQTAAFIQEIESSGFLSKAATPKIPSCLAARNLFFIHHQPLRSWLISNVAPRREARVNQGRAAGWLVIPNRALIISMSRWI
jgi:hypothetical protein